MRGISIWYIMALIIVAVSAHGCGPAFEAYSKPQFGDGGGLNPSGGGGPVVVDPIVPKDTNIIKNASFNGDIFSIWEDWGGSSPSPSGGVRISGSGQGGVGQELLFRVKTGATYQLSAQGKVGNPNDEVYLGMRFFDLSNATIADIRSKVSNTSLAPANVSVTIPKAASSAKVYVWKNSVANSTIDFDDFNMVMTAEAPPAAKEPAIANPNGYQPTGPAGNWALVFDESFNGTGINSTYWNSGLWFNSVINGELQAYRPENVRVNGGSLDLVSESRPAYTTWNQLMNYASGAITTRNKFAFTFGVAEARLRIPAGRGLYPVFSLVPNGKRSPPEINVMTAVGQAPQTTNFNYRYFDFDGVGKMLFGSTSGPNFSAGFHTFTVQWSETEIKYFVDGNLRGYYSGSQVLRDDAFILLSCAIGGTAAGSPDGSTPFPQSFEVDYVRVWQ